MDPSIQKKLRAAYVADEINYTETPLLETDVVEEGWYKVPPINNPPIEGQPITFLYEGNPNWYIDLDRSRIEIRSKITKTDGKTAIDAGDTKFVGPVNMPAHAMFRSCITQIQGQDVSPTDHNYPHRQNIAHQVTYTPEMNLRIASVFEGWEPDAPPTEVNNPAENTNTGLQKRRTVYAEGKEVTHIIQPCDGMWMQGKDLPPRFDLKLTLERTTHTFVLMEHKEPAATMNAKLVITYIMLHLRYKVLQPTTVAQHRALLASPSGMTFHLKNGQIKLFNIPQNTTTHTIQGVYTGLLPPVIVMALVDSADFNGSNKTNPFNYQNNKIESIDFRINGKMCMGQVIRPSFVDTKKNFLWEYFQMLQTTGFVGKDTLDISREQWETGSNLWVFETAPFAAQLDVLQTPGGIDLEIRFSSATGAALTLVALGQKYESVRLRDNRTVEYYRDVS